MIRTAMSSVSATAAAAVIPDESMTTSPSSEQIQAARAYEELFVPAIFRQWAPVVLDAAGVSQGDRVLDVACGTGVLAREALTRVGPGGAVAGVDLAVGMLAVAREIAPDVDWREGTAEALPFDEASFDAVVSQYGLMFFTDRAAALREMLRVLVPSGRVAVAVWDSLDRMPAISREVDILERIGGTRAADALRAPFVLGDIDGLASLAKYAGLDSVEVAQHEGRARFPSVRSLVEADLRGWLPLMGVVLEEDVIAEIIDAADRELVDYVQGDGAMVFKMPALIVRAAK
jgi:SAM-dependent methyltransferase